MRYLLDTNVLSELRKSGRLNEGVRRWATSLDDASIFLSVLVIGEIRRGIDLVRRRDSGGARRLDQWLTSVVEAHGDRILSVDLATATVWGALNVPSPIPVIDGLLAATALVHDLTLVTRNTKDVRGTGVRVLDPFS